MVLPTTDLLATLLEPVFPTIRERAPLTPDQLARRQDVLNALCHPAVVPEDADSLEYWQLGTFNSFKPRNAWEDWLCQMASVLMFRISRAERIERKLRDLQSLRALDFWEDDQALAAEEIGAHLTTEPGPTYARLWSTMAGCDWLIARWSVIKDVPSDKWSESQKLFVRLVCPVRHGEEKEPGFVALRITQLQAQRERNRASDRALRALVEADVSDEVSKPLARLRRYRASLQRDLKWFVAQLRVEQPEHRLDHRYRPDFDRRLIEPPAPIPTTPETSSDAIHAQDETDPTANLAADVNPLDNETKPTEPTSDQAIATEPIAGKKFSAMTNEEKAEQAAARKRRPDPAREVARQRKAARRRSA